MKDPKEEREKMQEKQKNAADAFNQAETGNLSQLVNALGWKGIGIILFIIAAAIVIKSLF